MALYRAPATPFVAGFIGSPRMNLFDNIAGVDIYGIRPEHLTLSAKASHWGGTVRIVERLGADAFAHIDVAGLDTLIACIDGEAEVTAGQQRWASPMPGRDHRFHVGLRV